MSNYSVLKALLDTKFYENNDNEITGTKANEAVKEMVDSLGAGYQFAGIATPSTNPGTPDERVFYIALPGKYTNFGATTINVGEVGLFVYDSAWTYNVLQFSNVDFLDGYARLTQSASFDPNLTSNSGYACVTLPVKEGDKFHVICTAGSAAGNWATYNASNAKVRGVNAGGSVDSIITIQSGETMLVVNIAKANPYVLYFYGATEELLKMREGAKSVAIIKNSLLPATEVSIGGDSAIVFDDAAINKLGIGRTYLQSIARGGYVSSPGTNPPIAAVSADGYLVAVLKVEQGQKLVYHRPFSPTAGLQNLNAFFDETLSTKITQFTALEGDTYLEAPAGAAYLALTLLFNDTEHTTEGFYIYEANSEGQKVRAKLDTIKESFIASRPVTIIPSSLLVASDGSVLAFDASSMVSDWIEVEPFREYLVTASSWFGYAIYAFYDGDKDFISAIASDADNTPDELVNKRIVTPKDCRYMRLSRVNRSAIADMSLRPAVVSSSGLSGKKWACMGDSLTEVNAATSMHYHDYIAERCGINVVNLGVGGSGYWYGSPNFKTKAADVPVDADVVTIFGSFNDVRGDMLPIGDPTDSGTATICGYINDTFDVIFGRITLAHLGIITPCPWDSKIPGQDAPEQYVTALIECCRRRSIPVLDLFHCSNLRPWDATFRAAAYTHDGGGGVHPDEEGHKLIAPMIAKFLEEITFW